MKQSKTFHNYVEEAKGLRPNATPEELHLCVRLLYIKTITNNLLKT